MQKTRMKNTMHADVLASCKRAFCKLGIPLLLSASIDTVGCYTTTPVVTTPFNNEESKRRVPMSDKDSKIFCKCYCDNDERAGCDFLCITYIVGFDLPESPMNPNVIQFCVSKLSQPKKNVVSGNQPDKK